MTACCWRLLGLFFLCLHSFDLSITNTWEAREWTLSGSFSSFFSCHVVSASQARAGCRSVVLLWHWIAPSMGLRGAPAALSEHDLFLCLFSKFLSLPLSFLGSSLIFCRRFGNPSPTQFIQTVGGRLWLLGLSSSFWLYFPLYGLDSRELSFSWSPSSVEPEQATISLVAGS